MISNLIDDATQPVNRVLFEIVMTLGLAVVLGLILDRLRQSVLIGYVLAGLLLGPHALGVIRDVNAFSIMAELGVALLLFAIGLELPWHRVHSQARRSFMAGLVQVAVLVTIAIPILAFGFGLASPAAIAIAMALSLSSTAVVIRALVDRAEFDSVHGLAALGLLLAQDLATVGFLLVVPELGEGSGAEGFIRELGVSFGKLLLLIACFVVIELVVIRRMFRNAPLRVTRELLALLSIAISLGSIGFAHALELSPAMGGFIAGMIMADAPYAHQVRAEIAPIRMALVAMFFAWIGMLADLSWVLAHAPQIIGLVVLVIVIKMLVTAACLRVAGTPLFAAVIAAAAVAQLGEFSFALVALARAEDLISTAAFQMFISVSLVTLVLTPSLLAGTSRFVHRPQFGGFVRRASRLIPGEGHAIVIGYGPAGRKVVSSLVDAGVTVTVVELNPRLVTDQFPAEVSIVYGDAAQPEILERADLAAARIVVITIPEPSSLRRMVRQVAVLRPEVPILARGRYHIYLQQLADAGAHRVIDEESVAGERLAQEARALLGEPFGPTAAGAVESPA